VDEEAEADVDGETDGERLALTEDEAEEDVLGEADAEALAEADSTSVIVPVSSAG
jgi:hypothetical protein